MGARHAPRAHVRARIVKGDRKAHRTIKHTPNQLLTPPASARTYIPTTTFTKEISFEDFCFHKRTNIVWPNLRQRLVLHMFEDCNKIQELGRTFIKYLNEMGLTDSTLITSGTKLHQVDPTARNYYCDLTFSLRRKEETFTITLELTFQFKHKQVPPGSFVSKEQLMAFLTDVLVLQKDPRTSHLLAGMKQKIKALLILTDIRCSINDLELEL